MSHPSYNRLRAERTRVNGQRRVRLRLQRRNAWGWPEGPPIQFTFSERTLLTALRSAGYSIVAPEER